MSQNVKLNKVVDIYYYDNIYNKFISDLVLNWYPI